LEHLVIAGRIILKCMFRKWDEGAWAGSGYGQVTRSFVCSNEPSVSIKFGKFLD
jgi:hypothetical protein